MRYRFIHGQGHYAVEDELRQLIKSASTELKVAVCFFRKRGLRLFDGQIANIGRDGSYVVCSVAWPTDLEALAKLAAIAPGHVYIHLGGVTPVEVGGGRALMHSKVFLALSGHEARLWVGSHNLTSQALRGGNLEAAVELIGDDTDPAVKAARDHLEACKDSAELFDSLRMPLYKELQETSIGLEPLKAGSVLVIRAEYDGSIPDPPFFVQLLMPNQALDGVVQDSQEVHLYLSQTGRIASGSTVAGSEVTLFVGKVNGIVHTETNSGNRGAPSELSTQYEVEVRRPPRFQPVGTSAATPETKVEFRVERRVTGTFNVYSLGKKSPLRARILLGTGEATRLVSIEDRQGLYREFTHESFREGGLVYEPVAAVRRVVKIGTYDRPGAIDIGKLEQAGAKGAVYYEIEWDIRKELTPFDRYVFVSGYRLEFGSKDQSSQP